MRGDCFFHRLADDLFEATHWTRGPWSDVHQHAGPPSALVAGRLEEMLPPDFRLVRVTVEVTRPVPIGRLRLKCSFRRQGRSVRAVTGRLYDDRDAQVMQADALAIGEVELDVHQDRPPMDERLPEESRPIEFPFFEPGPSYAAAMELRFARGAFGDGDVMAWMRMRMPLLPNREPSPLERVMAAADSGNGVSQRLSTRHFTFLNPDLAVTLHRHAVGEWVGLAARTHLDRHGVGLADTRLYDQNGPIGRGVQTLLVRPRG